MREIVLDGNEMKTKVEMHDYLKNQFILPYYYARNLDSLYQILLKETDPISIVMKNKESIAIGYGENQGQNHKSKPVDQISQAIGERPEWFEKGIEMALLAPTAMNQQSFVIKLCEDGSVEFTNKGGFFSKVDLGIVKCHFEIGSGRKIEWT